MVFAVLRSGLIVRAVGASESVPKYREVSLMLIVFFAVFQFLLPEVVRLLVFDISASELRRRTTGERTHGGASPPRCSASGSNVHKFTANVIFRGKPAVGT